MNFSHVDTISYFGKKREGFGAVKIKSQKKDLRCLAMKGQRFKTEFSNKGEFLKANGKGLVLHHLTFTSQSEDAWNTVSKFYDSETNIECEFGSGPLGSLGSISQDYSVFVGQNKSTGAYIVNFSKEEGFQHLQKFFTQAEVFLETWKVTSAFMTYSFKSGNFSSNAEIYEEFNSIIAQSPKKSLKLDEKNKNILRIGSRSSVTVELKLSVSNGNNDNCEVDFKIDGHSADKLSNAIFNSGKSILDFKTASLAILVGTVSQVAQTNLIVALKTTINKQFALGSVNTNPEETLNPSVKYVKSSLKGVLKLLLDSNLSFQIQTILFEFLTELLSAPQALLTNKKDFVAGLKKLVDSYANYQESSVKKAPTNDPVIKKILENYKNGKLAEKTALTYLRNQGILEMSERKEMLRKALQSGDSTVNQAGAADAQPRAASSPKS